MCGSAQKESLFTILRSLIICKHLISGKSLKIDSRRGDMAKKALKKYPPLIQALMLQDF